MKTGKTNYKMFNTIDSNPLDVTNRQLIKFFSLPIWLAVVMSISLGFVTKPVKAESTGTEGVHPGYRYIKPKVVENTTGSASQGTKESSAAKDTNTKDSTSGDQKSQTESVSKAAESAGTLPTFAQSD